MKRIVFISLALFVCVFGAFAQTETPASNAEITFEKENFNFGDIKQGEVVKHTFKFTNTGTDALVISDIKTTCGCTTPKWTRDPLPPGESGEIVVQFNSSGKIGKQHKVITIISNASEPIKRISIDSNVLTGTATE